MSDAVSAANHGLAALAGIDFLHQNGMSDRDSSSIVQAVTAESFFSAVNKCEGTSAVASVVDLNCDPGEGFEENEGCRLCRAIKLDVVKQEELLEAEAASRSAGTGAPYAAKAMGADVRAVMVDVGENDRPDDDPCRYVCRSCIAENTEQSNFLTMREECAWDDSFTRNFQAAMHDRMASILQGKKQVLDTTGAGAAIDTGKAVEQIVNRVTDRFTVSVRNYARQSVLQFQTMTFAPGSQSILATKNTQVFDARVVMNVVQGEVATHKLYDQADVDAQVTQYSKHVGELSGVRDSLAGAVRDFTDLWSNAKGQLMMIVTGVLLIFILAAGAFMYFMRGGGGG
jgi:hypothetical protein